MECPRCGGTLETYTLWGREAKSCGDCNYVGVPVEHTSERESPESWDDAIDRFNEKYGESEVPLEVAELDATELPEELRAGSGDDADSSGTDQETGDRESEAAEDASEVDEDASEVDEDASEAAEDAGEAAEDAGEVDEDEPAVDESGAADDHEGTTEDEPDDDEPGEEDGKDAESTDPEVTAETDGGPATDSRQGSGE